LGGACLYIAAKYQEISTPRLKRFVEIADGAYSGEELLFMESEILLTLKFGLY
jgi:cyclin A